MWTVCLGWNVDMICFGNIISNWKITATGLHNNTFHHITSFCMFLDLSKKHCLLWRPWKIHLLIMAVNKADVCHSLYFVIANIWINTSKYIIHSWFYNWMNKLFLFIWCSFNSTYMNKSTPVPQSRPKRIPCWYPSLKNTPFHGFWTKKIPLFQPNSLIMSSSKTPY